MTAAKARRESLDMAGPLDTKNFHCIFNQLNNEVNEKIAVTKPRAMRTTLPKAAQIQHGATLAHNVR